MPPLPSHPELIHLINTLYSLDKDGFCAGLRKMRTQAFFCFQLAAFYDRLYDIKRRPLPFFDAIRTGAGIASGNGSEAFQAEAKKQLLQEFSYRENVDIFAFLDGVVGYQDVNDTPIPRQKGRRSQQEAYHAESILLPVLYDEKEITHRSCLPFTGVYNEQTLTMSLIYITEALKNFSEPVSFSAGTGNHAFSFDFYRGSWSWFDANYLEERRQYKQYELHDLGRLLASKYKKPIFLLIKPEVAPDLPEQQFHYLTEMLDRLWQRTSWLKLHTYTSVHKRIAGGCGFTLAYIATMGNDTRALSQLASSYEAISKRSSSQETPLYLAAYTGLTECVRIILNTLIKHNVKAISSSWTDGSSPLFIASQEGYTQCVQLLVNALEKYNSAALNNFRPRDRATPLLMASQHGHTPCVRILVGALKKRMPQSLYFRTKSGITPLFAAARHGEVRCVSILVEALPQYNPQALHAPTLGGNTPLSIAIENGHVPCVRVLLRALQQHYPEAIERPAPNGKSPLRLALYHKNQDCVRLITDALKKRQLPAHYFCIHSLLAVLDGITVSNAKHQNAIYQLRAALAPPFHQFACVQSPTPEEKNLFVTNSYHAIKTACEQLEAEHATLIPWIQSMIVFLNKHLYLRNCSFFGRRQLADIVQYQWEALAVATPTCRLAP